jgi:cytochrome c-type biogenesis protein CcmH/NrfG
MAGGFTHRKNIGEVSVKKDRPLLTWLAIFFAGFMAGVALSAWKLDTIQAPAEKPAGHPTMAQQQDSETEARIAGIKRILEKDPNNVTALIQLGNDYMDTGKLEESIEAYGKALKIDPNNADVVTDLGVSYRRIGKPEQAVKAFEKALKLRPDHSTAMFNLGIVLRKDIKDKKRELKAWEDYLAKAHDQRFAVMVRQWVEQLRQELSGPTSGSDRK